MAEEEKKEEVPYQFTPEGQPTSNSSKGYTGRGLAIYPNAEQYDGDYVDGVTSITFSFEAARASIPTPMAISTQDSSEII